MLGGALAAAVPAALPAQHPAGGGPTEVLPAWWSAGVHGIPLVTRATPTAGRQSLTEAYLTQAVLMAMGAVGEGRLEATAMLNLEGLTMPDGELTTGAYGEGYVDRRHPHAYLHEAIVTLRTPPGARQGASLSAGRGFATFGSDDPMVRPFTKYPVNHHLAQVLERGVVAVALHAGPLTLEASTFNGDEPTRAADLPALARVGDSWALRITAHPAEGVELAGSRAHVASPEVKAGYGADARKWHASARVQRGAWYGLAEWALSTSVDDGLAGQSYASLLSEAAWAPGVSSVAVRIEQTDRHEEERLADPFRTAPGTGGAQVLAVSRWRTVTIAASRRLKWGRVGVAPFLEGAAARPAARAGVVFDPAAFYGATTLWMFTAGARFTAGPRHARMGRYGVAAATPHRHH